MNSFIVWVEVISQTQLGLTKLQKLPESSENWERENTLGRYLSDSCIVGNNINAEIILVFLNFNSNTFSFASQDFKQVVFSWVWDAYRQKPSTAVLSEIGGWFLDTHPNISNFGYLETTC